MHIIIVLSSWILFWIICWIIAPDTRPSKPNPYQFKQYEIDADLSDIGSE
jgi:hypothetical protein